MMDSAQEVLQSMGVPVDFEELYFSEVLKKSDLLYNYNTHLNKELL